MICVKHFLIPYPDAYSQDNTRYAFTDHVSGERYEYIAGHDGIDENWIAVVKEEDRRMNADDKRFERWLKRRDGEGYIRTVISLEEISMDHIENSLAMQDDSSNAEEMLVAKDGAQAFSRDYEQALKSLSESLQAAWVLFVDRNLSIGEIADYLNLPYETVKKRLQRARKTLQKILQGYCPQDVPD